MGSINISGVNTRGRPRLPRLPREAMARRLVLGRDKGQPGGSSCPIAAVQIRTMSIDDVAKKILSYLSIKRLKAI